MTATTKTTIKSKQYHQQQQHQHQKQLQQEQEHKLQQQQQKIIITSNFDSSLPPKMIEVDQKLGENERRFKDKLTLTPNN